MTTRKQNQAPMSVLRALMIVHHNDVVTTRRRSFLTAGARPPSSAWSCHLERQ